MTLSALHGPQFGGYHAFLVEKKEAHPFTQAMSEILFKNRDKAIGDFRVSSLQESFNDTLDLHAYQVPDYMDTRVQRAVPNPAEVLMIDRPKRSDNEERLMLPIEEYQTDTLGTFEAKGLSAFIDAVKGNWASLR